MSVELISLAIHHFRNHAFLSIDQPKRLIIIIGRNAVGKTNIIEAFQLITMLESFRNPNWSDVVQKNEINATINADFLQNGRELNIQMDITEGRRSYFLNRKKKNRHELQGLIPGVIFVPDDLNIIKDSSEIRRKLIDETGKQLSQTYLNILVDYQKIVKQRNSILKEQKENGLNPLIQESWDENLVILGALLSTHRLRLYQKLIEKTKESFECLTNNEELTGCYLPSFTKTNRAYNQEELVALSKEEIETLLRDALKQRQDEERARGTTLVGPHRDEINFFINNYEARQFASQGQQRSIALALKLGQLALIREISGNQPVLLLDDVMSELDEQRRRALIQAIDGQVQTVITATDLSCFNESLLENAQIIELG